MTVVRVLPDVPAIDRHFDYLVPDDVGDQVRVGTMVRVPLHGRRVVGWVLATDVEPPPGITLAPISKVGGEGPPADVIELCRWAAWRWAGRLPALLRPASPPRAVPRRPAVRVRTADPRAASPTIADALALGPGVHVAEVSPTTDLVSVAVAAAATGQALVVVPGVVAADHVATGLRRHGSAVARWPRDWQAAAGGATVVGGRAAVFAPAPELSAIVVIDEHDESLQNESSPTWHARELAVERARRAGVPCVLVSPCPSLEAFTAQTPADGTPSWSLRGDDPVPAPAVAEARSDRRSGWAPLTVVDRRGEDTGRSGLYSSRVIDAVRETARSGRRVVCVLNRTGRARLLACRGCGTIAECDACGAAVHLDDDGILVCPRCEARRPMVCLECGSSALSNLRLGVTRAREELEALAMEPVVALTGSDRADSNATTGPDASGGARIVIGTEAALHRVADPGLVVFLDLDQELLAQRYRASEECLALLLLASRQLGGRSRGGRLMVQTRRPEHEVVQAALRGAPGLVAEAEADRRRIVRFPPAATVAVVGGEAAAAYIEAVGTPLGVEVLGPNEDRWLLRADEPAALLDHLATVVRPPGRLRLRVDPARLR